MRKEDVPGIVLGIGLLAAALFTAGAVTEQRQQDLVCRDNLRRLYTMTGMYCADHHSMPPVSIPQKPRWKFWNHCLEPYAETRTVFCCPADPRDRYVFESSTPLYQPKSYTLSYGMNWFADAKYIAREGKSPPVLRHIGRPHGTVLYGDCKLPYFLLDRWDSDKAFRHRDDTANFVFADGHVECLGEGSFGTRDGNGKFLPSPQYWIWYQ